MARVSGSMKAMAEMTVLVRAATDVGRLRGHNEDSHGIWIPEDPADRTRRGVLLVVADGMGGAQGGQVASRLAVESLIRAYQTAQGTELLEDLRAAVEEANRAVNEKGAFDPALTGMGTTCTALVVRDHEAFIAHVGDSRAYLVRDGRIHQLTRDHSVVAQLVDQHQLTPELASVDPRRNLVTRSVGVKAQVEVDAERVEGALQPGDTFLLCSDGLHGQVNDEELARLASGPDVERACRDLIALANGRGGPDNITVLLTRVEDDGFDQPRDGLGGPDQDLSVGSGKGAAFDGIRSTSRVWTVAWLLIAVLALLLALIAVAWLVRRLNTETGALGLSP